MDTLGTGSSGLSIALAQTFSPQLERQWNRKIHLVRQIPISAETGFGNGYNIGWDVEFSGADAKPFAEGLDVQASEASQDVNTKATLNWGLYRSVFHLSNLEINAARANQGNARQLEDIVGERVVGALSKIAEAVESDVFVGTGTGTGPDAQPAPTIVGLDVVLTSTGNYGGLARTDHAEWASTVSSHGGIARPLTLDLMAVTEESIFNAYGESPNLLVMTAGIHTKYEGMFNSTVRTVSDGQGPIQGFHGSSDRLYWRGDRIVRARKATSGNLYMLNTNELELRVLPYAAVPDGVAVRQVNAIDSNGTAIENAPILLHVYPLARMGSSVKFAVEVQIQLKVKRPNAHARIADILQS